MHVVLASHHRLPVEGYGGTQRVVVALAHGLVTLGHRVTLLAQPGTSVADTTLVPIPPRELKNPSVDLRRYVPSGADVLHAHFPIRRIPDGVPFLQTLHGNLKPKETPPPNNVFLSLDHARRYGSTAFVYNGLDPSEFRFRRRKEQWDLFLGRLHSSKGYHLAVEAAKASGRRLILAGGWRPSFTGSIKYVGEVDGSRKAALLARARCLWNPALWDEPFGLVSIEALFSGTPVLGTRRGALPEIITPAVGALCQTLEEMIEASAGIGSRSPDACREHAERHFTHLVMAEEYVRVYRHLASTGSLPPGRATPWAEQGVGRRS
jgi:glycosyltransferase involved in cell wall biosynthesis